MTVRVGRFLSEARKSANAIRLGLATIFEIIWLLEMYLCFYNHKLSLILPKLTNSCEFIELLNVVELLRG